MGAIVCEVKGWESVEFEIGNSASFARGVRMQREQRCPHCDSIIYSRRHGICGVCGEGLPEGCLFSVEEARSVETLLKEERARHRKWLHRFNN